MPKTISKAVHELIGRRRDEAIDVALAKGYGISPQGEEENSWADQSLEGLEASNLDW